MSESNPRDRIVPFTSKFAFGVGQFAEGLKNTGFSLFILFYYNQVLGLSGTLAGLALAIALLFDAVTDPLAGSLSDNWKSKLGRRHPFMYASAIPLALAFLRLFSPPEGMGDWGLFFWLTLFAILTRGSMTLYHVPHLALGAEMSENFDERNKIVAYRQFFGTMGTAAVSVIGLGYFFADANGGRLAVENYTPFALTLGVLMVITIWYSAWGTQKEIPHLSTPPEREKRNPLRQLVLDAGGCHQSIVPLAFLRCARRLHHGRRQQRTRPLHAAVLLGTHRPGDVMAADRNDRGATDRRAAQRTAVARHRQAIRRDPRHGGLGGLSTLTSRPTVGRCVPRQRHIDTCGDVVHLQAPAGRAATTGFHLLRFRHGRRRRRARARIGRSSGGSSSARSRSRAKRRPASAISSAVSGSTSSAGRVAPIS